MYYFRLFLWLVLNLVLSPITLFLSFIFFGAGFLLETLPSFIQLGYWQFNLFRDFGEFASWIKLPER